MKLFRILLITAFLITFSTNLYSQNSLTIYAGPSFSVGDFGSNNIENDGAGLAGLGLGFGLTYVHPLNDNGLGVYGGLDLIVNPYSDDGKEQVESLFIPGSTIEFPKYINIPISAGLDYRVNSGEKVSIYGQAGASFNVLKLTDASVSEEGVDTNISYDPVTSLGLQIGAGLILNDTIDIGIKYYGLGEHEITEIYSNPALDNFTYSQSISLVMFRVGYRI